eukprot:1154894-Pelagomonas_calceolata.AAC.1
MPLAPPGALRLCIVARHVYCACACIRGSKRGPVLCVLRYCACVVRHCARACIRGSKRGPVRVHA